MLALRPYQARDLAAIDAAHAAGHRAVCYVSPTGSGKSRLFAELLRRDVAAGHAALFIAHLDVLLEDAADRIRDAGLDVGIIKASRPVNPSALVQVASLGTLAARGLTPPARRVLFDECHHAPAPSARAVIAAYPPETLILGATASPQRGDGAPLGDIFQHLVQGPTVRELTAQGHLVPAHLVVPEGEGKRGDLLTSLAEVPREGLCAIVFAESVAEGAWQAQLLTAAGYRVREVYGHTRPAVRREAIAALRSGLCDVLVGVSVMVEGFDCPRVNCVALDATFGTLGRYLQAIGRGLRPYPGKVACTVLDLRGAVYLHLPPDVPHEWSLTGEAVRTSSRGLALSRCTACWAVFEGRGACPRCGELRAATFVPRRMADEARMVALEAMPEARRHELYRNKMIRIGMERRRMSRERAERWADAELAKRLGAA